MNSEPLPHWDMSPIFPGLDSPEFAAAQAQAQADLDNLKAYFDAHALMLRETPPAINAETVTVFETALERVNAVSQRLHMLSSYITGFISTDSRNALAQSRYSEFAQRQMALEKLNTRLTAWLGGLDAEALLAASEMARDHAFTIHKARIQAAHLMSPEEESLATELNITGGSAWAKFYENFSSQITAPIELDGETRTLPMTAIRNLAFHADRDVRRRAYEVELAAWATHAMPIASALNSVKGQLLTLSRRRGWDSPLEVALFQNHINRATLDAMFAAAREFFPVFWRYLRVKAQRHGAERLPWYDLFAPEDAPKGAADAAAGPTWPFSRCRELIIEEFTAFSPRMGALAERAFAERWIDAEPRDGKRGGAFCMWVRDEESRVLANFQASYAGLGTLAHELGHAYHNMACARRTYLQRRMPMTLAETASNFCEGLMRDAALRTASPGEQLAIMDASLQDSTQVIVDITSRYLFETQLFARRNERELTVEELCALMTTSQRETYGDGLDDTALHPYMWAVKPHYYSSTFYNFPYMFGLLFSLGLYAHYRRSPGDFAARYEDLLSSTGMADAATLTARFGIDVRDSDFWRASLSLIAEDVTRFEELSATL